MVDAGPAGEDLLRQVDALAGEWLAAAPEIAFRLAVGDAEREAHFRLRYEEIVARGWADAESMPGGIERDGFDDVAVHVIGWDGARAAAAARLVFPAGDTRLPTEAHFDMRIEPPGRVVNLDRMVVTHDYRDTTLRVFRALLAASWLATRERGFSTWCGIHTAGIVRLYRRLGFDVLVVGKARGYWGQQRYPVRFEARQALVALRGKLGPLHERRPASRT